MSQAEAAKAAGIHKNTIQRWESGEEKSPQEPQLRAVADALGTDAVWLREGGAEKPPRVRDAGGGLDLGMYPQATAQAGATLQATGVVGLGSVTHRLRGIAAALQGIAAELEALNLRPADASVDELAGQVAQAVRSEARAKGARTKKKAG